MFNKLQNVKVSFATMLFLIVLLIAIIAIGPLLVLWSLNTLFTLGIPYDIYTWSAAVILGITINSGIRSK